MPRAFGREQKARQGQERRHSERQRDPEQRGGQPRRQVGREEQGRGGNGEPSGEGDEQERGARSELGREDRFEDQRDDGVRSDRCRGGGEVDSPLHQRVGTERQERLGADTVSEVGDRQHPRAGAERQGAEPGPGGAGRDRRATRGRRHRDQDEAQGREAGHQTHGRPPSLGGTDRPEQVERGEDPGGERHRVHAHHEPQFAPARKHLPQELGRADHVGVHADRKEEPAGAEDPERRCDRHEGGARHDQDPAESQHPPNRVSIEGPASRQRNEDAGQVPQSGQESPLGPGDAEILDPEVEQGKHRAESHHPNGGGDQDQGEGHPTTRHRDRFRREEGRTRYGATTNSRSRATSWRSDPTGA